MSAVAGDRSERISFAPGASGAKVKGVVRGYDTNDYYVDIAAGQRLVVDLKTGNRSNYFNVTAPGSDESLFIGSSSGDRFDGVVTRSGDYQIRVYLMRNAARRDESARYTLSVRASGGVAAKPVYQDDYADGLSGGPDWWEVAGVSYNDTLNMRTKPSTSGRIVAQLENGEPLRNLGCRISGGQRWCQVETRYGDVRGWVAGRYLREASRQY